MGEHQAPGTGGEHHQLGARPGGDDERGKQAGGGHPRDGRRADGQAHQRGHPERQQQRVHLQPGSALRHELTDAGVAHDLRERAPCSDHEEDGGDGADAGAKVLHEHRHRAPHPPAERVERDEDGNKQRDVRIAHELQRDNDSSDACIRHRVHERCMEVEVGTERIYAGGSRERIRQCGDEHQEDGHEHRQHARRHAWPPSCFRGRNPDHRGRQRTMGLLRHTKPREGPCETDAANEARRHCRHQPERQGAVDVRMIQERHERGRRMRWQEPVRDGERGREGQAEIDHGHPGGGREATDDRDEHQKARVIEHRQAH